MNKGTRVLTPVERDVMLPGVTISDEDGGFIMVAIDSDQKSKRVVYCSVEDLELE